MARRKPLKTDTGVNLNIGAIMTVSLFLILLTFFILLNSIAVLDEKRIRLSIGSLMGSFGSLSGGLSASRGGELALPPSAPMQKKGLAVSRLLSLINRDVADHISFVENDGKEIITLNQKAFFDDKLRFKESAYPVLECICDLARSGDFPVEIAGHTAQIPAEETGFESNWEPSILTATQVFRYLASEGKIRAERLSAYGCAGYRPIASNETRLSRKKNARVEIVLHVNAPAYAKRILSKKPSGIFTYKKFDFKVF